MAGRNFFLFYAKQFIRKNRELGKRITKHKCAGSDGFTKGEVQCKKKKRGPLFSVSSFFSPRDIVFENKKSYQFQLMSKISTFLSKP